MVTILFEERKL